MTKKTAYSAPELSVHGIEAANNILDTSVLLPGTDWRDEVEL